MAYDGMGYAMIARGVPGWSGLACAGSGLPRLTRIGLGSLAMAWDASGYHGTSWCVLGNTWLLWTGLGWPQVTLTGLSRPRPILGSAALILAGSVLPMIGLPWTYPNSHTWINLD